MTGVVTLSDGSGGAEMDALIASFNFEDRGDWMGCDDDGAYCNINGGHIVFTTDSYVVDPLFFPGGDIGCLAFNGTINDLAVMGAKPLGVSLALILEEGFPLNDLALILESIKKQSKKTGVPIVTGDTKVMEHGKIDKIVVNMAGVGYVEGEVLAKQILPGDKIILSGSIGEHAVALLSKRYDFKTDVVSDSKSLLEEISAVSHKIKFAKDPTRGGLAAALNSICEKNSVGIMVYEEKIPVNESVKHVCDFLGLDIYSLACEGRFICVCSEDMADDTVRILSTFNADSSIIGEITDGSNVVLQTFLGKRYLPKPSGRLVPRIC